MSMHYDSESLVDWGRSPWLFVLLVIMINLALKDFHFLLNRVTLIFIAKKK